MKLIGMMLARNEEHEIGLSARVALMWCDSLVILVHASTDRTAEIIGNLGPEFHQRVIVACVDDPKWDEMNHRQAMLEIARSDRATHVAIVDADEILTGTLLPDDRRISSMASGYCALRKAIRDLHPNAMLKLPGYNLRGGLNRYHTNGTWGNRTFSFAFPDRPELCWQGDRFHHREPWRSDGKQPAFQEEIIWRGGGREGGGIMHLWGASERRLHAKHQLYRLTEALRWPDKPVGNIEQMYSWAEKGQGGADTPQNWKYSETPESWWKPYEHLMHHLNIDAEPWQEAECRRIIAEHGRERFAGLSID